VTVRFGIVEGANEDQSMATPLSCYVLTFNSERRLAQVLDAARRVADDLLVVDSGSTDRTCAIAAGTGARILSRAFDNFRDQRVFAEDHCAHDWILALDSDEVLSAALCDVIADLKRRDFDSASARPPDAFGLNRQWFFCGQPVRIYYPISSPEHVVRLFHRSRLTYRGARAIHEQLQFENRNIVPLDAPLFHYSADSIEDLYGKVGLYTSLSADEMVREGEDCSWLKLQLLPWAIWAKWYLLKGGWRDGEAGQVLARYARHTVYLKYLKLRWARRRRGSPAHAIALGDQR
jgi:glycosyltransferase involved in cell wall biosynthesis